MTATLTVPAENICLGLYVSFGSGQIYYFCYIQVAARIQYIFRNSSVLDMALDDDVIPVCSAACKVMTN
jgi:hypothetical protein